MRAGSHILEIGVSLASLASLWLLWVAMLPGEPSALLPPRGGEARELARIEDDFATHRADLGAARALADRYLRLQQPQLAITTLRSADPQLLQDPGLAHRLARAYESSGRVFDALTTANLAYSRCARAIGSSDASSVTPVPNFGCSERQLADLRVHREALLHLARWGVQNPASDRRTQLAYQKARQSAHLAASSGSAE